MDELVKHMVDRFLGWQLPEDFNPDAGISFKAEYGENGPYPGRHKPIGTNLFDARQAEVMVRYMLEGLYFPPSVPVNLDEVFRNTAKVAVGLTLNHPKLQRYGSRLERDLLEEQLYNAMTAKYALIAEAK